MGHIVIVQAFVAIEEITFQLGGKPNKSIILLNFNSTFTDIRNEINILAVFTCVVQYLLLLISDFPNSFKPTLLA